MERKHVGILAAAIAGLFAGSAPIDMTNVHWQRNASRSRQGSRSPGRPGVAGDKLAKRFAKGSAAHCRGF
jgi:hypothetical protein